MKQQDGKRTQKLPRIAFSALLTPICALTLGSAVLLSGCGGSGGGNGNSGSVGTGTGTSGTGTSGTGTSGTGTGGTTPPTLAPAIASLNSLVRGSQPVTVTSLTGVAAQFAQATQADPTNKDAQLGFAVSEAALASAQAANLTGGTVVPALRAANASASLSPAAHTTQISQALVLWRLPQFLSRAGGIQLPSAADFLPTGALQSRLQPRAASVTPAQVQTQLAALDASLVQVESSLSVVESDPNYTYTLADPSKPSDTTATVKIGSAEIQILSAVVGVVRSVTNAGLAYNADPGSFNFNAQVPASIFSGATVSPAQYLPPSPFLTLMPDGGARLATVKLELNGTANSGVTAIEAVKTRNNAGYLLNPGTLVTSGQLDAAETKIKAYQTFLSGTQSTPFTVHGNTISTRVNLSAFLDHPPTDLRAFLPILPVSSNSGDTTLTFSNFPDATFGGIFPDGLPSVNTGSSYTLPVISGGNPVGLTYSNLVNFALSGQA